MTKPLISIVVLSTDLNNFNAIHAALSADSRVKLLSGGNDPEQLYEVAARHKPTAALICLGANSDQAIQLVQRLTSELPETAVISAGQEAAADLILQSLRAGAREFIRLPINVEELRTVLDRISKLHEGQIEAAKKTGRMTAVFSCKGGCGTSFIATNIAACMDAQTVLVDLNLEAGDLPLFLGLNPKYSIADMVARRETLDDRLISVFVSPYSANLHLLAAPKEVDPIEKIKPEHVFEVLQKLRECYDHVVLDPQHTFDAITLAALDHSDDVVLVLTLDFPAIRSAQRALQIFDRAGYPRSKVRIVVNRFSKQVDLNLKTVEEILGEPVIGSLPSDYQSVVNSINLGKPLVRADSRSKIAREIRRVTKLLLEGSAESEEPKARRPWSFFQKRQAEE